MLSRILIGLALAAVASTATAGSLPEVVQPQPSAQAAAPTCKAPPGAEASTTCAVVLPASALESGSLVLQVTVAAPARDCGAAQVLDLGAPTRGAIPIVHGSGRDGRKPACQAASREASSADAAP